nr:glycosyltransferase [Yersinia enterocolitica]
MPEVILTTVEQFCKKHSGYEIFLVGTVDTSYSIKIQNTDVTVLSKLPKKEYIDLLASCDVVIALIYSAHPGVIAFQAAASGIPTVTNEFDNRKKDYFLKISNNLIPYNPVVDSLLGKIEDALRLSKGDTRFDYAAYAGLSSTTFEEFNYSIQKNVTVLSKLPKKEYIDLLASCDVVIALIYSAHPGVIAFQAAASGIPTVTNEFDNRKKDYFLKISNNLIPYNPVVDSLLGKIEDALRLSKGDTRFDYAAYAGLSSTTFEEFNYSIQKSVQKL